MAGETSQLALALLTRCVNARQLDTEPPVAMPTPLLRNLGVDIAAKPADYLTTDPDIQALEDGFYSAAKPVFGLYQRVVLRLGEEHGSPRATWHCRGMITVSGCLTDNGGAYRSALSGSLVAPSESVICAPGYRPQTNGKAERFIQTLVGGWAYGVVYPNSTAGQRGARGEHDRRAEERSSLAVHAPALLRPWASRLMPGMSRPVGVR